ncbi:MAG: right-handed parallel beta-helix repeat-containing protein [Clostridia bacterium]|nr:right-handed parallel beta-helix repeat-containing protein [Clostridia bacterium]
MQTIYFRDHQKSGDTGYDLYRLLTDLRGQSGVKIVFDKDTYTVTPDRCFERSLNISNHGWNGPKRIAALIEDMTDIELDFSGSTLITPGVITPFAFIRSKGVTVRNVIMENPQTMFLQAKVVSHGDGYVDLLKMQGKEQFRIRHGELLCDYYECLFPCGTHIEYKGDTGEIETGTADNTMGVWIGDCRTEDMGNDILRVHGVKRYPPIGNILIISAARRLGCGFFCEDTTDILCENVTLHSCYGMGILAQTCENITLRSFNVLRHGDQYYTVNADGTHFVNCTGLVTVENSTFEGQLDDALNIHGMYTKIIDKTASEIFVNEVHSQAKGIRIYRAGDRIQVLKPDTLIPYTEKSIKEVEYVNADLVRLVLNESTEDILVGDDIESLTRAADLIFRGNIVRNNRARGMLIATRGKTVIEDCYFHSSGSAILFESNGDYWYESGGVQDVTIRRNNFDGCKHGGWGRAIVDCVPRKATEEGKYFNREIKVLDNTFHMVTDAVAILDNIEHAVFRGNTVTAAEGVSPKVIVRHVGNAEIETDLPIEG